MKNDRCKLKSIIKYFCKLQSFYRMKTKRIEELYAKYQYFTDNLYIFICIYVFDKFLFF